MPPFDRTGLPATQPAASDADVIHLINPLWDSHGGSDWRTIEMYRALRSDACVRLWSRFKPAEQFTRSYPVELIRPWRGRIPRGGTFVFVGAYFRVGHWYKVAFPRRTILVYNTHQPDRLERVLQRLRAWHRTPVEVVYTSPLLRRISDHPGVVIESPIDLVRFSPSREPSQATRRFRVGRLSRDIASKHHRDDPGIYAALLDAGVDVRIMGGSCLRELAPELPDSTFIPAGAEPPTQFLHRLDCFYYRTSDRWLEAYGRVVFEAMACGLPVVCGQRGGYADYTQHGVNGFLVDSKDDALALLMKLRDDPSLRQRVGRAARRTAERIYSGAAWRQKEAFFRRLRDPDMQSASAPELLQATPWQIR